MASSSSSSSSSSLFSSSLSSKKGDDKKKKFDRFAGKDRSKPTDPNRLDMDDLESEGGTPRSEVEEVLHVPEPEEKMEKLKTRMQLDIEAAAAKAIEDKEKQDAVFAAKLAAKPKNKEEKIFEKFRRIYGPPKKKSTAPQITKEIELTDGNDDIVAIYMNRDVKDSLEGDEFDAIFQVHAEEHRAAAYIQRFWKRFIMFRPIRRAAKMSLAIVPFQSLLRGVITRKYVARWHHARVKIVKDWQARTRRFYSNKHLRPILQLEQRAIIEIQRIVRGKLGRVKAFVKRGHIAAARIQCMWRGVVARVRTDMMWLQGTVIPIQCMVRRYIAIKGTRSGKGELDEAATIIQSCFRCWVARKRVAKFLQDREMDYREDTIVSLMAEEEWAQESLARLAARVAKGSLKKELDAATNKLFTTYSEIYALENDYIEAARQREILSPRAIQQGWVKELDISSIEFRNRITKMKLHCIFNDCMKVSMLEREVERKVESVLAQAFAKNRLSTFREQEYTDRRERFYDREIRTMAKAKKMAIAEERRKWQVKFFTKDGKPDKLRRPGKPWDPSVYAKPDKDTYCSADVDLFAFNSTEKGGMPVGKPGSEESVKDALSKQALQTYLEQMNTYEQILNPIQEIMQRTLGKPPAEHGKPPPMRPEQLGFGTLGVEIPKALSDIGAVPSAWGHSDKDPYHNYNENHAEEEKIRKRLARKSTLVLAPIQARKSLALPKRELKALTNGGVGDDDGGNTIVPTTQALVHYKPGVSSDGKPKTIRDRFGNIRTLPVLKEVNVKRMQRIRERRKSPAVIPWKLLDELEGEKKRFENEVSYVEFNYKY